jgi:hypothetical protein
MTAQGSRPYKAGDKVIFKISDFRREVDENCVLLGYNAAGSGNSVLTFRDKLSGPTSGVEHKKGILKGSRNKKKKRLFKDQEKKILDAVRWVAPKRR